MSGQHYIFDDKQWQGCAQLEQLQVQENGISVRCEHCIMLWLVRQRAGAPWQAPFSTQACLGVRADLPHHASEVCRQRQTPAPRSCLPGLWSIYRC